MQVLRGEVRQYWLLARLFRLGGKKDITLARLGIEAIIPKAHMILRPRYEKLLHSVNFRP